MISVSTASLQLGVFVILALSSAAMPPASDQSTTSPSASVESAIAVPFKEEKVGDFEAVGVRMEGVFVGSAVTIDEAFTTKYENKPPSTPFRVILPKDKDLRLLPGGKKSGAPELLRITLPDSEGKKAVEILRFGPLHVPEGSSESRLQATVTMLRKTAYPMFTNGFVEPKELDLYLTKVGEYDAAVMHIEMKHPTGGEHFLVKAIAILHPTQGAGVVGFLMADRELSEVKKPDDLATKGVGIRIIHSVKFLED